MNRKKLNIGLFGFGCVGYGLYEVLSKTPALKADINKICVKDKNKVRPISNEFFTFDKEEILGDESINVVIELIDDADAAYEIVSTALKRGKSVITANKKMLAEHFSELLELQRIYKVPLLYEGACCASIPIIRNLEEYYDNDLLESIGGIVNGSTNYILSKIEETQCTYAEALKGAQELGYAESDPLLDTGGFDAKYKLLILIAHAFGLILKPEDIFNIGIDKLGGLELGYAREKGLKIKLIAQSERNKNGRIVSFVMPQFVNPEDQLFKVSDVFNGIRTKSCFSDTQFFMGKGAGAYPTASAVLSDLSALSYDYRYEYKKLDSTDIEEEDGNVKLKILWRHHKELAVVLPQHFDTIIESFYNQTEGFLIGIIDLYNLKKLKTLYPESSFVLFEVAEVKHPRKIDEIPQVRSVGIPVG